MALSKTRTRPATNWRPTWGHFRQRIHFRFVGKPEQITLHADRHFLVKILRELREIRGKASFCRCCCVCSELWSRRFRCRRFTLSRRCYSNCEINGARKFADGDSAMCGSREAIVVERDMSIRALVSMPARRRCLISVRVFYRADATATVSMTESRCGTNTTSRSIAEDRA